MDWYGEQRQRAIEIILYWHGRINTRDLIATFGMSRIHASRDIKAYRTSYPENLYYNQTARAHIKSDNFSLHLTQGELNEYIDHVSRMRSQRQHVSIERLSPSHTELKPNLIAKILHAISERKAIAIVYASMNQPEGKSRVVHPHSLVDTGFRWHVRAYCEEHDEFRDFNLGRIIGVPEDVNLKQPSVPITNDKLWNKEVMFKLIANPALNKEQRGMVEKEFTFNNGSLTVTSRACLIHYQLQRYQINSENLENPEKTQLLAVMNPNEITSYLFGA